MIQIQTTMYLSNLWDKMIVEEKSYISWVNVRKAFTCFFKHFRRLLSDQLQLFKYIDFRPVSFLQRKLVSCSWTSGCTNLEEIQTDISLKPWFFTRQNKHDILLYFETRLHCHLPLGNKFLWTSTSWSD